MDNLTTIEQILITISTVLIPAVITLITVIFRQLRKNKTIVISLQEKVKELTVNIDKLQRENYELKIENSNLKTKLDKLLQKNA